MKAKNWISQFRENASKADIKLWFLTTTREWQHINDDKEMPKGRMQLQIGLSYYDFYNSQ